MLPILQVRDWIICFLRGAYIYTSPMTVLSMINPGSGGYAGPTPTRVVDIIFEAGDRFSTLIWQNPRVLYCMIGYK
jgi:hypothetical protein